MTQMKPTYRPNRIQRALIWIAFKFRIVGRKSWFRNRKI